MSTQVNKIQRESTGINTCLKRVNTSPIRVNTNQHESKAGLDHEEEKIVAERKKRNLSVV